MSFDLSFLFNNAFLEALKGIPFTLSITAVTMAIGIPVGFFIAYVKMKKVPVLAQLAALYVSFIQGTPLIIHILVVYSLLPSFLNVLFKSWGLSINVFTWNNIIYAYLVFTFYETALLSETIRSALLTVDAGQLEAAYSSGLTTRQAYLRIIIPQALSNSLPNLCTRTVSLLKSTSLAFCMSISEIMGRAKTAAAYSYRYVEAYLAAFLVYIIVCLTIERLFKLAEKYVRKYRAAAVK